MSKEISVKLEDECINGIFLRNANGVETYAIFPIQEEDSQTKQFYEYLKRFQNLGYKIKFE